MNRDGVSGEYWQSHRVSTERFIEVCQNLNHVLEEPVSPLVEEFASVIAYAYSAQNEAMGFTWAVTPEELSMHAGHSLQVLRKKEKCASDPLYDGLFKHMPPNLLSVDAEQLQELYLAIPTIVRAGFPQDFADEVDRRWDSTLKYWGYREDLPRKSVDELLPITEVISTVDRAKVMIVDSAEEVITKLDWQWAIGDEELTEARITELFHAYLPCVLNRASIVPVLGVLRNEVDIETLAMIPADQNVNVNEYFSLVLPTGPISSEDATLVRDNVCLSVAEEISGHFGSSDAVGKLLMTNPGLQQAIQRQYTYFERGFRFDTFGRG